MATTKQVSPAPETPPDENLWETYSANYEMPISSLLSLLLHVAFFAVVAAVLWYMAKNPINDRVPVPMRTMEITADESGEGDGSPGSGGGEENVDPNEDFSMLPMREIPDAVLNDVVIEIDDWVPKIPQAEEGLSAMDLEAVQKIARLNDDIRKVLLPGKKKTPGKGLEEGKGNTGQPGTGVGGTGDSTTSKKRSIRWDLRFSTNDGKDYLSQLAAMKAALAFPQPPDWKSLKVYKNLDQANPRGENFDLSSLPSLYFIDDAPRSVLGLSRALGLNFQTPQVIAFFPKDIEEELAAKERAYRNRREDEIFSTTFQVLIRNGKPVITVVSQTPIRR
ncbi:MAG: hypothetical protein R3B84_09015 [Zavarzinella sp.]